jgi:hypothetical protein
MPHAALADLILLFHLAFILFVVLGGLLVARHAWLAWLHLPAVAWGAAVELGGGVCPLTPLAACRTLAVGAPGPIFAQGKAR